MSFNVLKWGLMPRMGFNVLDWIFNVLECLGQMIHPMLLALILETGKVQNSRFADHQGLSGPHGAMALQIDSRLHWDQAFH